MLRYLTLLLTGLVFALPLCAQEKLPPIEQAFPRDSLVYLDLSVSPDVIPLLKSIPEWQKLGAVGLGYEDLAVMLTEAGLKAGAETLRRTIEDVEKMAYGMVNVTGEGPENLFVIQHRSAREIIKLFEGNTGDGSVIFEKNKDSDEAETWTLQFPSDFYGNDMQMFWGGAQVREYTDPLTLGVFADRYLLIGNRKSHVLDAISQLEYADETEYSIQGSSAFREARKERTEGEEIFAFWNIAGTMRMVDRLMAGPMNRGDMAQIRRVLEDLLEVRQFSYAASYGDYDATKGLMLSRSEIRYFNKPTWLSIINPDPKPQPALDFVPSDASSIMLLSLGDAKELYQSLYDLVERKAQAIGDPEMAHEFREFFKEDNTFLGLNANELVGLIGSDHMLVTVPGKDALGKALNTSHSVAIFSVADEEKFRKVIEENLRNHEDPITRERFFKTSEQRVIKKKDGGTYSYNVFNASNGESAAWTILEGKFLYGAADGLEACLLAHFGGADIRTNAAFKTHLETNPVKGHLWFYNGLGEGVASLMLRDAEGYLAAERAQASLGRILRHDALLRKRLVEPNPRQAVSRELAGYLAPLTMGASLEITDRAIVYTSSIGGLPSVNQVGEIALLLSRQANSEEAGRHLREVVFPEVSSHLFREGKLPTNIESMSSSGTPLRHIMRDPYLAGASKTDPAPEECFVWLGDWGDRELVNPLPLAHSREAGLFGAYWLLMSDGSTHRVLKPTLDTILAEAAVVTKEPSAYGSLRPQTLREALPELASTFKLQE